MVLDELYPHGAVVDAVLLEVVDDFVLVLVLEVVDDFVLVLVLVLEVVGVEYGCEIVTVVEVLEVVTGFELVLVVEVVEDFVLVLVVDVLACQLV